MRVETKWSTPLCFDRFLNWNVDSDRRRVSNIALGITFVIVGRCGFQPHRMVSNIALAVAFERLEQPSHVTNAVSDILSAFWRVGGEPHDVVVVDDSVVTHIVQCFRHAIHVHITGVRNYFLVSLLFGNLTAHVAEVDVEDFALFPEMPNPLKDIFARLVTGAYAKGHTVVWGRDFGKEGGQKLRSCRAPVARRTG